MKILLTSLNHSNDSVGDSYLKSLASLREAFGALSKKNYEVDLVEDPRHAHQDGRSYLADVVHQLFNGLGKGHRAAHAEHDVELDGLAKRVSPRQERYGAVVRIEGKDGVTAIHVGREILVSEENTLGLTSRSRGVDESAY